jgi:hypothetical protein
MLETVGIRFVESGFCVHAHNEYPTLMKNVKSLLLKKKMFRKTSEMTDRSTTNFKHKTTK